MPWDQAVPESGLSVLSITDAVPGRWRHGLGCQPEPTLRSLRSREGQVHARHRTYFRGLDDRGLTREWQGWKEEMGRDRLTIHRGPHREAEEEWLQAQSPWPEHRSLGGSEAGRHPPPGHTDRLLPCGTPNSNRRGHVPESPACTCVLGTRPHTTLHPFPRLRNTAALAMSPSPLTSRRARDTFFQFFKTFNVTVKNVKDYRTQRGTCYGFPVAAALRSLAGTCSRHSDEHACRRMCPLLS